MSTAAGQAGLSPEEALQRARVIWRVLLLGQVGFAGVIGALFWSRATPQDPGELSRLLTRIGLGLLLVVVPLAYTVRSRIFRGAEEGRPTPPASYLQGTIVFLAMCEFVSLFSLVAVYLHGRFFPPFIATLAAVLVQAFNLPTGREMRPSEAESAPIEPH
ncbi:MAG TPA: hypothetical protein VKF61_08255 [Candidatus Polarisedimenticolia bacterium]|nr:hypothetical protein [Candidatus Polarisedimenticolia bacterium]